MPFKGHELEKCLEEQIAFKNVPDPSVYIKLLQLVR